MNNPTIKSNGPLTILLAVTLFSIATAQTPTANQQSDITHRVDQLFARFDRPDSPGCALGVAKDGKLIKRATEWRTSSTTSPFRQIQSSTWRRLPHSSQQ